MQLAKPSVRVTRAETRLTVYRSPYIFGRATKLKNYEKNVCRKLKKNRQIERHLLN